MNVGACWRSRTVLNIWDGKYPEVSKVDPVWEYMIALNHTGLWMGTRTDLFTSAATAQRIIICGKNTGTHGDRKSM